jgi:hypothetical protein
MGVVVVVVVSFMFASRRLSIEEGIWYYGIYICLVELATGGFNESAKRYDRLRLDRSGCITMMIIHEIQCTRVKLS